MDEERKLREVLQAARQRPREGWEGRAIEAMVQARPGQGRSRWRIAQDVGLAVLIVLAVVLGPLSASADSAIGQAVAVQNARASRAIATVGAYDDSVAPEELEVQRLLDSYRERAASFVRDRYPKDAEMLMAAGLLVEDPKEGEALLRRATQYGKTPTARAAYALRLMQDGPTYMRRGSMGTDPQPTPVQQGMIDVQLRLSEAPDRLSPADVAPILEALRGWEEADPDNALPTVFRMRYAYGLHQDAEALRLWKEMAAKPRATLYQRALWQAVARLLGRMGMDEVKAVTASTLAVPFRGGAWVRDCARISVYEGRVAQIEGRSQDAVAWWNGTITLGERMQSPGDSLIGFLVGLAVEAIGASPTWKWYRDAPRGDPYGGGPLNGGRLYFGKQHAFYVEQVGAEADAAVRDGMLRGQARKLLVNKYLSRTALESPAERSGLLIAFSSFALGLLVVLALIWGAATLLARRAADAEVGVGTAVRLLLVVVAFVPMAYLTWWAMHLIVGPEPLLYPLYRNGIAAAGAALTLVALVLLSLLAAAFYRRSQMRFAARWRGVLRSLLPPAIVLCALVSIAFGLAGRHVRAQWLSEWYSPDYREMKQVMRSAGAQWEQPKIPADAWRAEYPPEPE